MKTRRGRLAGVLVPFVMLATLLSAVPVAHAQTAFVPPRYLRTIGGDGRPGVFSWGVAHNPLTNEIIVSDYLNFQLRRYDPQGNLLGNFWRPDSVGQPYSVAVDPVDGAIYVAELKDNPLTNRIVKYDRHGTYLYAWTPTGPGTQYQVWLTVDDQQNVWALDSHYWHTPTSPPRAVRYTTDDATKTATREGDFPVLPPGTTEDSVPRLYGIDVAADGSIYMSDAFNRRVYRYQQDGTLLATFGTTQTGGDNRGVAVNDDRGLVYVVDAQNSDIDVFDIAGEFQFSFGDPGGDAGEFDGGGRQLTLDADGNVWVADFGGFETEKYSWDGTALLTAPRPAMKPPVGQLAQPRDVAVDRVTGEVWVADAWAQRFQRFSATGVSMGAWGTRGGGGAFQMNYPRTIAIDPVTRRIWVANERGHHIQVYTYPTSATASPTYVRQIGLVGADDTDPGHFRWPVDVEFFTRTDGTRVAVIGDRMAASVKIFNAATYQELLKIPNANHGTAVDPATGNIFVNNGSSDRIDVYDQAGVKLFEFGSSGTGDGQFRDPVDSVISGGVLYVVDESAGRVQAFDLQGTFLGRWGGSYSGGAYDLRNPAGIDADPQGRLYVTDSQNDRIQVFNPAQARVNEIQSPAVPTVSAPAQRAVLPLAPVTFTGTAADNASVANVELSIQHLETGMWWNSANSSWEAAMTDIAAMWTSASAPATSVSWRSTFTGVVAGGTYLVYVKTRDASGNLSGVNVRTFGMPGTSPPAPPPPPTFDTVRPDGRLSYPARQQAVPLTTVQFAGTATDNVGVTQVRVALKHVETGRWWSGSGSTGFSTSFRYWDATLDAPGATSTGWSWPWMPRVPGTYRIQVQARDAAGNVDGTMPNVMFSVTSEAPDAIAPDTTLTAPTNGATVPSGAYSVRGSATDNIAVASVRVSIQDTATGRWWNGTGWNDLPTTVSATLASPNAASTNWTYGFNAPEGSFAVQATAFDTSNMADPSPASASFTAAGAPDTTAPTTLVTSPPAAATVSRPVTITGSATDDVGVVTVRVAIRNNATLRWWNGSSWGTFTFVTATLGSPGAGSTTWTYVFEAPASGSYGFQARSLDAAGNLGTNSVWRRFTAT